jgi:hypothetical protein
MNTRSPRRRMVSKRLRLAAEAFLSGG